MSGSVNPLHRGEDRSDRLAVNSERFLCVLKHAAEWYRQLGLWLKCACLWNSGGSVMYPEGGSSEHSLAPMLTLSTLLL